MGIGKGNLPSQAPGPKPMDFDCILCQAKAYALRLTDAEVYLPACNGKNFKHLQVDDFKKETFCVERDGEEIKGSRQKGMNGNCSKFPRKPVLATLTIKPPKPCTEKALEATKAKTIPRTFHLKGKNAPNCANHQAFTFNCQGKGESLQPHPTDCTRYVKCSNAGVFSCACGVRMAFDRKEGICNHETLVKCARKGPKQG